MVNRPLPVDDPQRRRPDISRAREILNWEPVISLEEGLQLTLEWAKKNV
jgi:UDP-glucuronate decarboxylase